MTLQDMLQEIPSLTIEERKTLINALVDSFIDSKLPQKRRKLSELAGLGAEIWEGVDAQEYINQLRNEWDERS